MSYKIELKEYQRIAKLNDFHFNRIYLDEQNLDKYYEYKQGDFKTIGELGSGGFAMAVLKVRHNLTHKTMAVKVLSPRIGEIINNKDDVRKILNEFILHRNLTWEKSDRPKNIVEFYGLAIQQVKDDTKFLCFMECMNTSLAYFYKRVHKMRHYFPENLMGYIIVQIINGLSYCGLREKPLIHKDLKPPNILINWSGEVKICDFGSARIQEVTTDVSHRGTFYYLPPEQFNDLSMHRTYGLKGDIWAIGITMCELVRNKNPIRDMVSGDTSMHSDIKAIEMVITKLELEADNFVNRWFAVETNVEYPLPRYHLDTRNFVKSCLKHVQKRPLYNQLVESEFYMKYRDIPKQEFSREILLYKEPDTNQRNNNDKCVIA